jgi:peptidoglycan/xylan/chitin deacetylase (PgdA/CDA1 family)
LLRDLRIKATFFVVGKMVEKNPDLVRLEVAQGHEIGDHSFSHVNLSRISEQEAEVEYQACKDLIKQTVGFYPTFCRPPGGQATPAVLRAAAKCGLSTVMWTDDPRDYENPGPDVILERLMRHVSNGAVILLHEGVDESMEVLPTLVNTLRNEGYRFVTMSELAGTLRENRNPHVGAIPAVFHHPNRS